LVFGTHGFLVLIKQATCYPGFESGLSGAEYLLMETVVMDGNILTGKGACLPAMVFSLTVLGNFKRLMKLRKSVGRMDCCG